MRAKAVTAEEQYRLIMECRASGMTDYQWCVEHDIKPGTFYNWAKRQRQSGTVDIPASAGNRAPARQDVVEIDTFRAAFCCHAGILKNSGEACKINDFMVQ